jgi:guanylate kinase
MKGNGPKQIVVISGPTACGKNAISAALLERCSNCSRLVTATTRAPRPGEKDGVDYYFLSKDAFISALAKGDILEHREVKSLGTHYGVYGPDLEKRLDDGGVIVTTPDIIAARYLKEHYGALTIFINVSSLDSLRERIHKSDRGLSDDEIEKRIEIAKKEIAEYAPEYDYRVINRDGRLNEAVGEIIALLEKEDFILQA